MARYHNQIIDLFYKAWKFWEHSQNYWNFQIKDSSIFASTSKEVWWVSVSHTVIGDQPSQPMTKKNKEGRRSPSSLDPVEIVKQMKDQVPVVLLNQWLGINPEKSHFARKENCLASDEYSVYSDETMSK